MSDEVPGTTANRPRGRSEPEQDSPRTGEISRGMVALYRDHLGRGPDWVQTTIADDMVLTILGGSLTKAERKLAAMGREITVRRLRREVQQVMAEDMIELVERVTACKVKVLLSDHLPDPDFAVEVLILERVHPGSE